jgi:D-sedoheptulose 7-phosphate isomerase
MDIIRKNLQEAQDVLRNFISNEQNLLNIEEAGKLLVQALSGNRKVISCGNGGSMCDAMHFAEELVGRFRNDRRALPAIAISDASYITCTANDYGYDAIFSRFVEAFGKEGDILLAISTSGNSKNVIRAARQAKDKSMKVIGLTGKDGGELAALCDAEIRAPLTQYADRAQEIHIKVIHTLIDYIERNMFPK